MGFIKNNNYNNNATVILTTKCTNVQQEGTASLIIIPNSATSDIFPQGNFPFMKIRNKQNYLKYLKS